MELEEGEIVISDSDSNQEHYESSVGGAESIERTIKASRLMSVRPSTTCHNYPRHRHRPKLNKIKDALSNRRNYEHVTRMTRYTVQQRCSRPRGPRYMDLNRETAWPASVASSVSIVHGLKCVKENLVIKCPKPFNFSKRKSSNKKNEEMEKRHKGSHNKQLLKNVISRSGPRSVPSSTVVSCESRSLMSKLITAGLAKRSSDIEIGSEISASSTEVDNCNSSVVEKGCKTERKSEYDDDDSDIEVIIPPKKLHTVVTLDSDGEEVTHQLSGMELSQNVKITVCETPLGSPVTSQSKASSSICNTMVSKDQDSDCNENSSLRSVVTPLHFLGSDDNSFSLSFSPSSPSSCNSIETNFKDVSETLIQIKEQFEIKPVNEVLPIMKPQSNCLGTSAGIFEQNQCTVVSQNDITSICAVENLLVNLNTFSGKEQNSTNNINPILDSICDSNLSIGYARNESNLETINNKTILKLQAVDRINSTTTNISSNVPSTYDNSNPEVLNRPPMAYVSENVKTQMLVSESRNNTIGEHVSSTNQSFSSGKEMKDVASVSVCTEIHNRAHVNETSENVIPKDPVINDVPQQSNSVRQRTESNNNRELISDLGADIIDPTSSFLCLSLEKPVLEDLNRYNLDYVGSSNDSSVLKDNSSKTQSCGLPSFNMESRQCVNVTKNQNDEIVDTTKVAKINNNENSKDNKLDSDDDDISKLRLLALSSKGKASQSLTNKEDNSSCLETVSQPNTSADDENYDNEEEDILLLRVAALKSAVIKKHEKRKKKGLLVKKKTRVSIDLSSISDEIMSSPSKETSIERDSVDNIAKPLQKDDSSPESPAESLQGEEDMEISDSGDTSDNQEKIVQNPSESLEIEHLKNVPTVSYMPCFDSEQGNIFNSIVPIPPQPQPGGVKGTVEYSGCIYHNYSQPNLPVLPPPPPPPALIFNSLLSPPPPPPPESDELSQTLHQSSDSIKASQVESNCTYGSFQELESCSSNNIAHAEYYSERTTNISVKQTCIPSENLNSIGHSVEPIKEKHENVQTIEITSVGSETPTKKIRSVNKLKSAANCPLRRNLRKIPLAKNDQSKTAKNKLQRLRRPIRVLSQVIDHDYNESNSLITEVAKSEVPLCITNKPIQQSVNFVCPKYNFPLCTTDSSVLKRKDYSSVDKNKSPLLCSENVSLIGNVPTSTNKFNHQNSCSVNNRKSKWEPEEDGISPVGFQDEEMDLSNMIVLDEVGMSPEHKSSHDQPIGSESAKGHFDYDEDYSRASALSSLSSNHGPSKFSNNPSPPPHSISDSCIKLSGARKTSKTPNYEALIAKDQASVGKRNFKNFSITKKVNDCDSSIYKLTRVVTKEPYRSVVKGRESLKVVIPTETPPLLNSPQPFSVPVVERFVISVGKDSDSEEEGEWLRKVQVQEKPLPSTPEDSSRDYDLERSVDLLLSNTRQRIENTLPDQTKPIPSRLNINKSLAPILTKNLMDDTSDTPLHLLPKERQEEYMRLKKIIYEKEKQKQQQSKQKCIENREKFVETPTNYSKKHSSSTKILKYRRVGHVSSSSQEAKSLTSTKDNPNSFIPNEKLCYEKEDEEGFVPEVNQRDNTNIRCQPSRIQLPLKDKTKFKSEVENYLEQCLGTSEKKYIEKGHGYLGIKMIQTKPINECIPEKSNDVGKLTCKQNFPDILGNCVKSSEKLAPQHFEINSNVLINEVCKKQTKKKDDHKSKGKDQMKSKLITTQGLNTVSSTDLNKFVVDKVGEKSVCESTSHESYENIESRVENLNSLLYEDIARVISKNSIPDGTSAKKTLTSETLRNLSGDYFITSQDSSENPMDLNTSTSESLNNLSNCGIEQGKAAAESDLLCLVNRTNEHHNLSFQTSSNRFIENESTSVINCILDKEFVGKDISLSNQKSLHFDKENIEGTLQGSSYEIISTCPLPEENATVSELSKKNIEDMKLKALSINATNEPTNSSDADLLFSKQEELLCERFALMDELSEVSESMGKLEVELQRQSLLVADVERLRYKLLEAERQLQTQTTLTSQLEQRVHNAHETATSRHTLISSLETSCQQLGTRLRGPTYLTPVRGKELLEKKMKQMFDKRSSLQTKRETQTSVLKSLRSEGDPTSQLKMWDSKKCKDEQSIAMTKVDKQPVFLVPENSDPRTENCTRTVCPEIDSSGITSSEPTSCESSSSKSIYALPLPVVELQGEICPNLDRRLTKDNFSLKINQETSVKRTISSVDGNSNDTACCKKFQSDNGKDEVCEEKTEPKLSHGSSAVKKHHTMNSSKPNKSGTSKLHYKSVLQFKSNYANRNIKNQSSTLPGGVLCPYDLMGQCQDSQCQYQHLG